MPSRLRGGLLTLGLAIAIAVLFLLPPAPASAGLRALNAPCAPACARPLARPGAALDPNLIPAASVQDALAGSPVGWSAPLPAGDTATSSTWNFGDGSLTTASGTTTTHTYQTPGWYALTVNVSDSAGGFHTDADHVIYLQVEPSFIGDVARPAAAIAQGDLAELSGRFLANSSVTTSATGVVRPGGSVSVYVWVAHPATAIGAAPGAPSFDIRPPVTVTDRFDANASGWATVSVPGAASPGVYYLNYTLPISVGASDFSNVYTFTIIVAPSDASAAVAVPTSSHPGLLNVDQASGGGPRSLDPAIAYDTAGFGALANLYEQLITYNGSAAGASPADFDPALAECVPGSSLCQQLFGSTLQSGSSYTFVIDPHARFFDPATNASWPVYPSDVMFSLARTLAFADLPSAGSNNGWILAQALLPGLNSPGGAASFSWDGGLHEPYNNTPQMVLDAIGVNTTSCPAIARSQANGCVTLTANGDGQSWPQFLSLVASPIGGSIVPCGWASSGKASSGGAGIPYWTYANISGAGDQPCLLPGGATSTTSSTFTSAVNGIPALGWDLYEMQGSGTTTGGAGVGYLGSRVAGSGPYTLTSYSPSTLGLTYNPAYVPNPYCTWSGCPTTPSIGAVQVNYGSTPAGGLADVAAGRADLADARGFEMAAVDGAVTSGTVVARSLVNGNIYFDAFTLDYNASAAATDFPGHSYTAPANFLTDPNLRQFLIASYPYATTQAQYGEQGAFQNQFLGGMLPQGIGSGAPGNVTWPTGDPSSDAATGGTAAWWWARAASDTLNTNCTAATPCSFPIVYNGSGYGPLYAEWAQNISTLSGGALEAVPTEYDATSLIIASLFSGPGQNPMPAYQLGWSPDYADVSDYLKATWFPDSTYTFSDAVAEQFSGLTGGSCSSSISYWSQLTTPIPYICQGTAFDALTTLLTSAQSLPLGAGRDVQYAMADHIGAALGLYAGLSQADTTNLVAPWIDPSSLNANPMLGGSDDQLYAGIRYLGASSSTGGPAAVALATSAQGADLGVPFDLWANVTGPAGVRNYAYTNLPGCAAVDAPEFRCTPTQAGTFPVGVTVSSGAPGFPVTASIDLTVSPLPVVTGFSADPSPVEVNAALLLTATISGGTAPLLFAFSGLPSGCVSSDTSQLSCTPNFPGTYTVAVQVTDAFGKSATRSVALTVSSAAAPHGGGGGGNPLNGLFGLPGETGFEILLFAIVVLAVGLLAIVAVLRMGRRPPETGPEPTGEMAAEEPVPPEPEAAPPEEPAAEPNADDPGPA